MRLEAARPRARARQAEPLPAILQRTALHEERFARLVDDVAACRACSGVSYCHALSAANGPLDARVLFVAEAPGRRGAAITGVPLTGDEAGRRFEAFLNIAGLRRSEVFVTNTLLCNPIDAAGRNRRPTAGEVARCRPFLARTLALVAAPVVVALGRVALDTLAGIAPHEAQLGERAGIAVLWRDRTLVPLYHPGRQSTLHRPHAAQIEDWRNLAKITAIAYCSPQP